MPTYQYACTECGERLEAVQSFSDPALTVCPNCQGKLRKVFNSVGIVFKGSGFYRTDSRSGSGEKSNGAAPSSDSSTPSKSDGSSTTSASPSKSDSSSNSSASSSSSSSTAKAGAAS